jgi:hypothetical protein
LDVEQEQVRPDSADDTDSFLAGARLADDLESGADVNAVDILDDDRRDGEQLAQTLPKEALVV